MKQLLFFAFLLPLSITCMEQQPLLQKPAVTAEPKLQTQPACYSVTIGNHTASIPGGCPDTDKLERACFSSLWYFTPPFTQPTTNEKLFPQCDECLRTGAVTAAIFLYSLTCMPLSMACFPARNGCAEPIGEALYNSRYYQKVRLQKPSSSTCAPAAAACCFYQGCRFCLAATGTHPDFYGEDSDTSKKENQRDTCGSTPDQCCYIPPNEPRYCCAYEGWVPSGETHIRSDYYAVACHNYKCDDTTHLSWKECCQCYYSAFDMPLMGTAALIRILFCARNNREKPNCLECCYPDSSKNLNCGLYACCCLHNEPDQVACAHKIRSCLNCPSGIAHICMATDNN